MFLLLIASGFTFLSFAGKTLQIFRFVYSFLSHNIWRFLVLKSFLDLIFRIFVVCFIISCIGQKCKKNSETKIKRTKNYKSRAFGYLFSRNKWIVQNDNQNLVPTKRKKQNLDEWKERFCCQAN